MKTGKANGIFKLAKRGFKPPAGKVKAFDVFRGEFIRWKVGYNTFIRTIFQREPDNPDRKCISIPGAIAKKVKSGCKADKGDIITVCLDFF